MYKCKYCGKEFIVNTTESKFQKDDYSHFCSKFCARSYSSMNIEKTKKVFCKKCGKEFEIPKRSGVKYCKDCVEKNIKLHTKKQIKKEFRKCSICGRLVKRGEKCSNIFCQNHNLAQLKMLSRNFGFDETKIGTSSVEEEFDRIRTILYDLYWNKHLSGSDIGKMFGLKYTHVVTENVFRYLNIPSRSLSEATTNAYLNGNLQTGCIQNQYKSGWHKTWNGKDVYLRSSYELDYAEELDSLKIDYDVEFRKIKYWDSQKQKFRCAIPDFYIPSTNTIVEIKSAWTLDRQNMKDKVEYYKKEGYNFKLILEHKEIDLNDDYK